MRIFREKPGVISVGPLWVAIDGPYLYTHRSLVGLLWLMVREWRNDRHLVM